MKEENQYLVSESEVSNFVADMLSGEKPKPLLAGKKPVEIIASGKIICIGVLEKFEGALSFNINKSGQLIFIEEIITNNKEREGEK